MWQTEKGIVTGAVRHNDGTCIVKVFTETHGMIPFIFYLSKSGKKASRNTLIQPLTQIEFQTDYVPTATFMHMREPKNAFPYRNIPFNPSKSATALFMGEFLTHALDQEQANPTLYNWIINSIKWLDEANNGRYANFHILFALGTVSLTGICPNTDGYTPGSYLDLREGTFTKQPPMHNDYADAQVSYKIASLMECNFDNMSSIPLTGTERTAVLNSLNLYFRLHIPAFPQLKSIEVLQAVF
ncbi:MAG: DNA repair protein RecO C-terminal domain-containing protein [Bacteroidaceae bacterium]|nr:DNA repair protein RecO C-terminal domain-containing protein [Bacteroidaceae bacterium]